MHVSVKRLAFSGLMLAFTEILLALSGVLEFNTLFLLAAASFFTGIMIRESGMGNGAAFYGASVLLGLLLSPNKLYCLTYAAMGFYVLAVEWIFRQLGKVNLRGGKSRPRGGNGTEDKGGPGGQRFRRLWFWVCKFAVFNCLYLPALILLPHMLFPGGIDRRWLPMAALAGQAALIAYDLAYEYFMRETWEKLRRRTGLDRDGVR